MAERPELTQASARKALGQHFLFDPDILRRTALAAGAVEGRDVIEVGPGPGGLTRALLDAGARTLTCVEADQRFAAALNLWPEASEGRVSVIQHEARKVDWARLKTVAEADRPVMIIANLPYNVGTALFTNWLESAVWPPLWRSLTLMFQREVADRIVAQPGTTAYGRLAVLAQWRSTAKLALKVHRSAFTPPPKVMSAIVHLTPAAASEGVAPATLSRLTAAAFGQRRKMLRQSLKSVPGALEALQTVGVEETRRAETLSVAEFVNLARALTKVKRD